MSDIKTDVERVKAKILNYEFITESDVEDLINTIDDQYMTISTANMWNSKLKDQLDSAVKGLKDILNLSGDMVVYRPMSKQLASDTLSEIERLQNGGTKR